MAHKMNLVGDRAKQVSWLMAFQTALVKAFWTRGEQQRAICVSGARTAPQLNAILRRALRAS
jgi:hypothetical protein